MDKIEKTYKTASWIFRELITLKDFRIEIKRLSKTFHNNDFKKVCSRCGYELSQYSKLEEGLCNQCAVGMPICNSDIKLNRFSGYGEKR